MSPCLDDDMLSRTDCLLLDREDLCISNMSKGAQPTLITDTEQDVVITITTPKAPPKKKTT